MLTRPDGNGSSFSTPNPTTTTGLAVAVVLFCTCFATGFSPTSFAIGWALWLLFILLMWGWQHDV